MSIDGRTLRITENHPFYSVDRADWVEAKNLRIGDLLRNLSGESVRLDDIRDEYGQFDVYNIDVEKNHNYYAAGVLTYKCTVGTGLVLSTLI